MRRRHLHSLLVLALVANLLTLRMSAQGPYFYTYVAGEFAEAFGNGGVAIGYEAEAGEDSIAGGYRTKARGKTTVAFGSGADCGGPLSYSNVCVGDDSGAVEEQDYDKFALTVLGRLAKGGRFSTVAGHDAQGLRYTTTFGEGTRCLHQGSGCFGRAAASTRTEQLMLGSSGMPYKEVNISGRVLWANGSGAPSNPAPNGSLYSRLDGPPYLYVYAGDHWQAIP